MATNNRWREKPVLQEPQQSLIIGTIVHCLSTNEAELHFITFLPGYVNRVDAYIIKFTGR